MALQPCRECGKEVGTQAKTCPRCGIHSPVPPASRVNRPALAVFGFVFFFVLWGQIARSNADPAGGTTASTEALMDTTKRAGPVAPAASSSKSSEAVPETSVGSEDQSLIANVQIGYRRFLRTDHSYMARIVEVESDRVFEDGRKRDAIIIRAADGSVFPVPRKTAQQIYVSAHDRDRVSLAPHPTTGVQLSRSVRAVLTLSAAAGAPPKRRGIVGAYKKRHISSDRCTVPYCCHGM